MNGKFFGKQATDNCLSLIRLIAAFQVMFGHMIEHLELPISSQISNVLYFFRGVPVFFTISGFLIWFSIQRTKTFRQYGLKRFLRIYPELWGAVLIELIVMLLFYHEWKIQDVILFVIGQGSILQFWTPNSLRGYGVGTPNGALWTIGVMIQFYVVVWLFYHVMKDRKIKTWILGLVFTIVVSISIDYVLDEMVGNDMFLKLFGQTVIRYFWLFYIGMFIAEFKDLVLPICSRYWYAFLAIAMVFCLTKIDIYAGYYVLWSLFLLCGIFGFAYRFPKLSLKTDISYGLFLYHMTVINVFVTLNIIGEWKYVILVVVITASIAYCSTKTIGAFSRYKK